MEKIKNILEEHPKYEATIGIEVHVQLKTNSKIFCSCPNQFGDQPNTNICPICSGHPGILPFLNKKVVDFALMAGIATNSQICAKTHFARKHYFYPDLPKNYQITQASTPICKQGYITIDLPDGKEKNIRITRIHIEEDAGKNIHINENESFVDLNRAGTPLLEIVSYPDISNAYQARAYLTSLRSIVQYLGISDANMEEGSFRADVNISIKKKTDINLGTKVELKNINSFKFITNAIEYEIKRQIDLIESGEKILQETRNWDNKAQKSFFMRSKEEAQDYRYMREPDLPIIFITSKWLNRIKKIMPELPREKFLRFQKDYNLSAYEAENLISEIDIADFFEKVTKICNEPKLSSNWILRDLLAYLKETNTNLNESKITAQNFAELIKALSTGKINSSTAQEVFLNMAQAGKNPSQIIQEKGLAQIGSEKELEEIILKVIANNPEQVQKYLGGKENLFMFFVGLAMKETKGKANPEILQSLFKKHLKKI